MKPGYIIHMEMALIVALLALIALFNSPFMATPIHKPRWDCVQISNDEFECTLE